jgi:hypothetical protein
MILEIVFSPPLLDSDESAEGDASRARGIIQRARSLIKRTRCFFLYGGF